MSFLRRIWQSIRNPRVYVGRDLEGNRFYEYSVSSPDTRRTRRAVQYSYPDDVWDYIGGGKRLPVQWSSWLTHTRQYPPTLEELHADYARQQRVNMNAAIIEARDNESRAKLISEGVAAVEEAQRATATDEKSTLAPEQFNRDGWGGQEEDPRLEQEGRGQETQNPTEQSDSTTPTVLLTEHSDESPWVEHTTETLKPQSWSPRTRRR
ncbi:hypothetical protein APHAL10511_003414 [Amanita phalloides]|nr:hypothetical protein APHAL10511_003414 [Amanita phalloides]